MIRIAGQRVTEHQFGGRQPVEKKAIAPVDNFVDGSPRKTEHQSNCSAAGETSFYWTTVTVAVLEVTPLLVAVMVEVPIASAVASPVEDMLATELGLEVHVEVAVTSPIEPSL